MVAQKLLNLDGVRERLGDEIELVKELAQHYVENASAQLSQVEVAVQCGDPKALEQAAHSFKSSVAIFGADAAVTLAQALEDLGHAGLVDGAAPKFLELAALARQLELEITTIILGRKS